MPLPLKLVYSISCVFSGLGWVATVVIGRGGPLEQFPWLIFFALPMPIAFMLALGFSEDQRWTRPLMVLLLVATAFVLLIAGLPLPAVLAAVATVGSAVYLYSSRRVVAYYAFLRQTATDRISLSDLKSPYVVPLYLGAAGIAAGGYLGFLVVTRSLGCSSDLGANDLMAVVCAGVLGAVLLGLFGRWIGDFVLKRHASAAKPADQADAE